MTNQDDKNKIIQKALLLETSERTLYLNQINDQELKEQVEYILADDTQLTQFLIQTACGDNELQKLDFSDRKPGTKVNRITIEKLLGKGGMGSVYLGYDEKLKRKVAIKSIRPEFLQKESTRERFIKEAQILSQINHASICQIYDYIETEHEDFLVLEYIEGQHLNQASLNYQQKLAAFINLASALAAAHEQGIVHRDLKPDNILINQDGLVKVLDFGIAQSTNNQQVNDTVTENGFLLGTIKYMSPEQAQGQSFDESSDIYSLGVILQELFTEQAVYQASQPHLLIEDVKQGNRIQPSGIDNKLIRLITMMTSVNRDERPAAKVVQQQLEHIKNQPRIIKARRLKSFAALLLTLLSVFLIWQWYSSAQLKRSLASEQFNLEKIQSLAKAKAQIYQLPKHDISAEIDAIHKQSEQLADLIAQNADLTDLQKQRLHGHLAFESGQYEKAVKLFTAGRANNHLLATAWKNLYLEKVTAYLYGLTEAEDIEDIKSNYLQPALQYINKLDEKDPVLLAFQTAQTESFDQALTEVNQIIQQENWNNDALMLKANILLELSAQAKSQGSWEVAHSFYLKTVDTYKHLIERARSYPEGYSKLCEAKYALASDATLRTGDNREQLIESGLQACEDIFKVQPDHLAGMVRLSDLYVLKAQMEINKGLNSAKSLELAEKWSDQAIKLSRNFQTVWSRASIHTIRAMAKNAKGTSPVTEFDLALSYYHEALDFGLKEARVISNLLFAYQAKTIYLASLDINISDIVTEAKKIFDRGMKSNSINPELKNALYVQMAAIYTLELNRQYIMNRPIQPFADDLIQFISKANIPIDTDPWIMTMLASAHVLVAESLFDQNKDPSSALNLATQAINQAILLNDSISYMIRTQAHIYCLQALSGHLDFSQAHSTFQKAYEINPKDASTNYLWSRCVFNQAMVSQTGKKELFEQALTHIEEAIDINPVFVSLYKLKADIIEHGIEEGVFDKGLQKVADEAKNHMKRPLKDTKKNKLS